MRLLSPVPCVLIVGTFFSFLIQAQQVATTLPAFQIRIQTEGEGSPKYTVTNLTGKTVTAWVVSLSSSLEDKGTLRNVWDALTQNVPLIEPNASLSQFLGHRVGGPLPDNVEVVAGVWVDGETFGDPEWVNIILKNRESLVAAYDQAIAMLREGIDQKWTREQYLQTLNGKPTSLPFYGIRRTLEANKRIDDKPKLLNHLIQTVLDSFVEKSNQLKNAKPVASRITPGQ